MPLGFAVDIPLPHSPDLSALPAPSPQIANPSTELLASVTWSFAPSLDDGPSLSTWTALIVADIVTVVERPPLEAGKGGSNVGATYAYDGLGRRVKATEDGTTTFFAYGLGLDPIWEKTGTTETRHIYANGMRIARQVVGGATYYYHGDALGSTWRMTDAAKVTVFSTSYEPFGRSWGTTGSERFTFLGERNDTESGLTYLRARQYDSSTGRFTSMDPVLGALSVPQTLNRYPYVVNNPARYTDPTGRFLTFNSIMGLANLATECWNKGLSVEGVRCVGDPIMTAVGFVPIVGDIASTAWFVGWDLYDCSQGRCDLGMLALDAAGIIPGVPNLGSGARIFARVAGAIPLPAIFGLTRGANRAGDVMDGSRGWRLGDDINRPTRAGTDPSWTTVRNRFWKNEALFNPEKYSPENLARMRWGLAPLDDFGHSYELHHRVWRSRGGTDTYANLEILDQTRHRMLHWYSR